MNSFKMHPDPAGEVYDASPYPLVGWGGVNPPYSLARRLWRLDLVPRRRLA